MKRSSSGAKPDADTETEAPKAATTVAAVAPPSTTAASSTTRGNRPKTNAVEGAASAAASPDVTTAATAAEADFFARAQALGLKLTRQDYERARAGVSAFLKAERVTTSQATSPVIGLSTATASSGTATTSSGVATGSGSGKSIAGAVRSPDVVLGGSSSRSRLQSRSHSTPMLSWFTKVVQQQDETQPRPRLDDIGSLEERKRRREKRRRMREKRERQALGLTTSPSEGTAGEAATPSDRTVRSSSATSLPAGNTSWRGTTEGRRGGAGHASSSSKAMQGLGLVGFRLPGDIDKGHGEEEVIEAPTPLQRSMSTPPTIKDGARSLHRLSTRACVSPGGTLSLQAAIASPSFSKADFSNPTADLLSSTDIGASQQHEFVSASDDLSFGSGIRDDRLVRSASLPSSKDDSGVFFGHDACTAAVENERANSPASQKQKLPRHRRHSSTGSSALNEGMDSLSFLDRVMATKNSPLRLRREARALEKQSRRALQHDIVVMTATTSHAGETRTVATSLDASLLMPHSHAGAATTAAAQSSSLLGPNKSVRWALEASSPHRRMTTREHYDFFFDGIAPSIEDSLVSGGYITSSKSSQGNSGSSSEGSSGSSSLTTTWGDQQEALLLENVQSARKLYHAASGGELRSAFGKAEDLIESPTANGGDDSAAVSNNRSRLASSLFRSSFGSPMAARSLSTGSVVLPNSPGDLSPSFDLSQSQRTPNFQAKRGLLFGPNSVYGTPPPPFSSAAFSSSLETAFGGVESADGSGSHGISNGTFSQGPTLARSPARGAFETPPKLLRAHTLAAPFAFSASSNHGNSSSLNAGSNGSSTAHEPNNASSSSSSALLNKSDSIHESGSRDLQNVSPDRAMLMRAQSSGLLDRRRTLQRAITSPSYASRSSRFPSFSDDHASAQDDGKQQQQQPPRSVVRAPLGWAHRSPMMTKYETISPAAVFGILSAASSEGTLHHHQHRHRRLDSEIADIEPTKEDAERGRSTKRSKKVGKSAQQDQLNGDGEGERDGEGDDEQENSSSTSTSPSMSTKSGGGNRLDSLNEIWATSRMADAAAAAAAAASSSSAANSMGNMRQGHRSRESSASTSIFAESPLYLDTNQRSATLVAGSAPVASSSTLAQALGMVGITNKQQQQQQPNSMSAPGISGTIQSASDADAMEEDVNRPPAREKAGPTKKKKKTSAANKERSSMTQQQEQQQQQDQQQQQQIHDFQMQQNQEQGQHPPPPSSSQPSTLFGQMEWDRPDGSRVIKLVSEELQAAMESGALDCEPTPRYYKLPPGFGASKSKPSNGSYAGMIGQAILSSSDGRLSLNEIYNWISTVYPFFERGDRGWQNSIRHNLSLNKSFIKVERDASIPGKGGWWAIKAGHEDRFVGGSYVAPGTASSNKKEVKTPKNQHATLEPGATSASSLDASQQRKREPSNQPSGDDGSDGDYRPSAAKPQQQRDAKVLKKLKLGASNKKRDKPQRAAADASEVFPTRVPLQPVQQQATAPTTAASVAPSVSSPAHEMGYDMMTPVRPGGANSYMASSGHGSSHTTTMTSMPMLTDASSPPSSPNTDMAMPPPSDPRFHHHAGMSSVSQSARKRKHDVSAAVAMMGHHHNGAGLTPNHQQAYSSGLGNPYALSPSPYSNHLHQQQQQQQQHHLHPHSYHHTMQASPLANFRGDGLHGVGGAGGGGSLGINGAARGAAAAGNNGRLRTGAGNSFVNVESPLRRHSTNAAATAAANSANASPTRLFVHSQSPISSLRGGGGGGANGSVSMVRSTSAESRDSQQDGGSDENRDPKAAVSIHSPMKSSPLKLSSMDNKNQSSLGTSPAGMNLQMAIDQHQQQQQQQQQQQHHQFASSGLTPQRGQSDVAFLTPNGQPRWGLSPSPMRKFAAANSISTPARMGAHAHQQMQNMQLQQSNQQPQSQSAAANGNGVGGAGAWLDDPFDYQGTLEHELTLAMQSGAVTAGNGAGASTGPGSDANAHSGGVTTPGVEMSPMRMMYLGTPASYSGAQHPYQMQMHPQSHHSYYQQQQQQQQNQHQHQQQQQHQQEHTFASFAHAGGPHQSALSTAMTASSGSYGGDPFATS